MTTDTPRRPNPPILAGAVLLLALVGTGLGVWGLSEVWRTRDWVQTEGEVVRFELATYEYTAQHSGGATSQENGHRIKVWYRYRAGGQSFESARYSELEPWDDYTNDAASLAAWRERVELVRAGQVPVWYDPHAPAEAVLLLPERAPPAVVLAVALCLLVFASYRLVVWRRAHRAHAAVEAAP